MGEMERPDQRNAGGRGGGGGGGGEEDNEEKDGGNRGQIDILVNHNHCAE